MPRGKNKTKIQKKRWQFIINFLNQVPYLEGEIIDAKKDETFFGSRERGVVIRYYDEKEKRFKPFEESFEHNIDVVYKHLTPPKHEKKETNKTFKEQLIEKLKTKEINPDTLIEFIYVAYYNDYFSRGGYDDTWYYCFRVKEILPYLGINLEEDLKQENTKIQQNFTI